MQFNNFNLKKIRIKMLCNWQSSKELCYEWSNMCEHNFIWKNLEITWEDTNIDYYVIINYPRNNEYYEESKTIIYQMEPSVAIRNWGIWANPDESKFLFVANHKNLLNGVQLQIRNIPNIFPLERKNNILSILSNKNFDVGHIKRLNFIKILEEKNINLIDIYGRENYHNFNNYKGSVINNNKENCFALYKYCFQAENNSEYNYATEKIWEAVVCECLCFYWGCPNLDSYLNPLCFVRLDLDNIEESIQIIQTAIKEDWWSQRINIIKEEKQKIINELGFFPTLNKIINNTIVQ
jgi:hypothetical protein